MISPLNKKLYRDIYAAKGQFIAVILVIMCGIAAYITVTSAYNNLLLSRDTYCRDYRLADIFLRIDRAPRRMIEKLRSIAGVSAANGRIVYDVSLDIPQAKGSWVGRIISLPDKKSQILNDIHLTAGTYFRSGQENGVIINPVFLEKNHLQIGAIIWATINNRKRRLRIVGTALSPEYIYTIRNAQEFVPNPKGFAICYVKQSFAENAFGYQGAVNDVVLAVTQPERIDDVKKKAEDLLDPYGVLAKFTRDEQISYKFISDELAGLEVSAKVTPAIFLGVAALIIFIMLGRIIQNQRVQIGVLMALGYGRWTILLHYLNYVILTALTGCLVGIYLGHRLGGSMLELYGEFYRFPVLRHRVHWNVFYSAIALSLGYCCCAGFLASWKIMSISPATAMRPAPPTAGHRILLERWRWLWRPLPFTWKMIWRNLFRHKGRAIFIAAGIALSCAIMIQAFFSTDSMEHLIHHEFSATQQQDIKIYFYSEKTQAAIYELKRIANVRRVEPIYECAFEMKYGWHKKNAVITGLIPNSRMRPLFDSEQNRVALTIEGVTLSDRLAQSLGVRRGDRLVLKPLQRGQKERSAIVKNIVHQYLGLSAFMTIPALSQVMRESYVISGALLKVVPGSAEKVYRELKKRPTIATIEFKETLINNFEVAIGSSMYVMTAILSAFAGIISFAIIYNSAIISISERQRELSTLKVMGFSDGEIFQIIVNEYVVLALIGIALGLPLGQLFCQMIVNAYDTDLYRFPLIIYPRTYFKTMAGIAVFVVISQLACLRRLLQLNMVEVLKARE